MAQLREAITAENGQPHDDSCYCETCKAARLKILDDLYDRIEASPPWPTGRIDPDTQPELCAELHAAWLELFGPQDGEVREPSQVAAGMSALSLAGDILD
jgi:hypothetical protein